MDRVFVIERDSGSNLCCYDSPPGMSVEISQKVKEPNLNYNYGVAVPLSIKEALDLANAIYAFYGAYENQKDGENNE